MSAATCTVIPGDPGLDPGETRDREPDRAQLSGNDPGSPLSSGRDDVLGRRP